MDNSEERHFLDTNVLIGLTVTWDKFQTPVQSYFAEDSHVRYTSVRVCEEGQRVVERLRREVRQSLRLTATEFEGEKYNMMNDLYRFFDSRFEDGVPHLVSRLMEQRKNLYRNALDTQRAKYEIQEVGEVFSHVEKFFHLLKDGAKGFISVYQNAPSSYTDSTDGYEEMDDCFDTNSPDRDLALDAWELCQAEGLENLVFISCDGDFTDAKSCIESHFSELVVRGLA